MSISPISSISYNVYIPSYISDDNKKEVYENLKWLFDRYNITQTGEEEVDIARLRQAMLEEQIEQNEKLQETSQEQERPWLDIMWELGLHQQPTIQEDYDEITEELEYRILNAKDEQEYDKYIDMYNTIQEYFNEYGGSISQSSSASNINTLMGLSQLGVMNMVELL